MKIINKTGDLMKQQIIIFDFDNTLVDSLKFWYQIINKEMFIKYGKKIDKEFPLKRKGLSNLEIAQLFVDVTGIDKSAKEINQEVNEQMKIYYTHNIKMIKGAREFLLNLKRQGKSLVIATATDLEPAEIALKHFGIYDLFDAVFSENSIGKRKRDKSFLETCFKKLGCSSKDVFLFEDSVVSLKSAISLGVDCCGLVHKYNRKNITKLGIPLIKNYKNIKKVLKKNG